MSLMRRGYVLAFAVGVVSCGGATSTTTSTTVAPTTTTVAVVASTPVAASRCVTEGICVIGDTGPGGGIVFYVGSTTINVVPGVSEGGRYLEAAPNTWSGDKLDPVSAWGCDDTSIGRSGGKYVGTDVGTDVGTGAQNTKNIVTGCTTTGIAADLAINLEFGGQSDWFLPSRDELALMYFSLNASGVGGFASYFKYWSSSEWYPEFEYPSEFDPSVAWAHFFSSDDDVVEGKGSANAVRPVRAFGTDTLVTTVGSTTCLVGGTCQVGDTGPGGGIVFFDAGSTQSWGRYLEAAPNTWNGGTSDPVVRWGCDLSIPGASGTAVGAGQTNTTAIVAGCTTVGITAQLADALTFGGQSDWFLPSRSELVLMYINRKVIGDLASEFRTSYWSSSQSDFVWAVRFDSGERMTYGGDVEGWSTSPEAAPNYVRPVRAFG